MTDRLVPEVITLLDRLEALGLPPMHTLTPAEGRRLRKKTAELGADMVVDVAGTRDGRVPTTDGDVPVRWYEPLGRSSPGTIVYFHGGGWVFGDLDTHDTLCRTLSNAAGMRVVAVQYRLAPEHPHPAPLEDAWAATTHVAATEAGPLIVGGDSAGGHLATCVCSRARKEGIPIAAQLLIYPVTDLSSFETPSYAEFAEGYWLTAKAMEWFRSHLIPEGTSLQDRDVSPLYREDLSGMPPAVVITAECDVLKDEGEAYADRLREAGVPVRYRCYDGVIHGFMALPGAIPQGAEAIREAAADLHDLMAAGL